MAAGLMARAALPSPEQIHIAIESRIPVVETLIERSFSSRIIRDRWIAPRPLHAGRRQG